MGKLIDIIIVNWNSGKKAEKAMRSYLKFKNENISCNLIVVDNASNDNSVHILKELANSFIINKTNEGFGKACNQAFQISKGEYILLLNPDTQSSPLVLEHLVKSLEMKPECAIIGPQQRDEGGNILKSCSRFPTFNTALYDLLGLSKLFPNKFLPSPIMTEWNHESSRIVDHVIGSYMLIKRSVIDQIGFIDERYFMYLEDLDFSKRVMQAGFKTFFDTTQYIIHEGGSSGNKVYARRLFYSLRSRSIYWKKHFSNVQSTILILISISVEPFLRIINSIIYDQKPRIFKILKAYFLYIESFYGKKR
jgi:GT2 family glycosyltransferase